jgi:nicotinate-nucleotide pyrophosphorylase (carboxylating)
MTGARPQLDEFVERDALAALLRTAMSEDLGPKGVDATSAAIIPQRLSATASVVARKPGILAGAALLGPIAAVYDKAITVAAHTADGDALSAGQTVAELAGPLRSVLAMERVALNFLTHLSGIATLTGQYVARVAGTRAGIYDTRKTIPGMRGLEKYAVACGGGGTHRIGLYDAVLIKDNHLAHLPIDDLAKAITDAAARARAADPDLKFVQVEVDTLGQLERVLAAPIDIVLLDNMPPEVLKQAVELRDRVAPKVELEASGGVNLDTVRAIAESGVDRISVGALTHSAPALDLGLDIVSRP